MRVLRDRSFRRLLIGTSLSSFGDSALYLTLGIWAKDLTGSNGAAGSVFLAQGLATLSAPFAGQLADRIPRRRLLIVTNAMTGLAVITLLTVHTSAQLWVIYAVALAYGAAFGLIAAATAGLLKDLVADEDLASANAALTTLAQGLRIASALAGAALYAGLGGGAVALLDSATFLAAICALLGLRVSESPIAVGQTAPVHVQLLAGLAHVRHVPLLRQIVTTSTAAMLVLGFYESITFAVVDALNRPPSFFGVLMSVQAAGSIAGGLLSTRIIRRLGEPRSLGVAFLTWAIASLTYSVPTIAATLIALVLFGFAVPVYAVALATATQRYTPPRMQGRVSAFAGMTTRLSQTISIATGAVLVDSVGYRPLLVTVAAGVTAPALTTLLRPASAESCQQPQQRQSSCARP